MLKLKKPEFGKILIISTAHITERDDQLLREDSEWYLSSLPPKTVHLMAAPKYGGYIVYVETDKETWEEDQPTLHLVRGYSKSLLNIVEIAREAGCGWVMFDSDGPGYPELPTFE